MKRTLSLRRDALAPLTHGELGAVAGGAPPTQPLTDCLATLPVKTANPDQCLAISDAHTCIDCLTRFC